MTGKIAGANERVVKNQNVLRKPKPIAQTLEDILQGMETLDSVASADTETVTEGQSQEGTGFGYDEYIDRSVAQGLLGDDYDPACMYKLITQQDATIVLRIDPRIPEGEETPGSPKRITEFVLEEDKSERVVERIEPSLALCNLREEKVRGFKFPWIAFTIIVVFLFGISLWCVFMWYLLTMA